MSLVGERDVSEVTDTSTEKITTDETSINNNNEESGGGSDETRHCVAIVILDSEEEEEEDHTVKVRRFQFSQTDLKRRKQIRRNLARLTAPPPSDEAPIITIQSDDEGGLPIRHTLQLLLTFQALLERENSGKKYTNRENSMIKKSA